MHQAAFPGEDISDRPAPGDASSRRCCALVDGDLPSGRYRAADLPVGRRERPGDARRSPSRPDAEATAPPEWRGLARDEVRLLAVRPERRHVHRGSASCPTCSSPATSSWSTPRRRCRPGSTPGGPTASSSRCTCRRTLDDGDWVVELRRPDERRARTSASSPATVLDAARRRPRDAARAAIPTARRPARLWRARTEPGGPTPAYLPRHGRPIRYGYLHGDFPLADFQTVYADRAGQRRDGQRRTAVHRRGCWSGSWPAASPSSRWCCTPASPAPSCTSRPYPERFAVPEATARLVERHPAGRPAGRRRRHHRHPGAGDRAPATTASRARPQRVDRPRPRPGPAGARRDRPGHRPARAGGQPPAAARGGRRARPRRTPRTTSRRRRALPLARVRRLDAVPALSRVTPPGRHPAGGALQQRPPLGRRAARARRAQRPARQPVDQAARRPPDEPAAPRRPRSAARAAAAPRPRPAGRPAPSPARRRPRACPSASSRLASESVAIAHSGRSRIPPASATAADHRTERRAQVRGQVRRPGPRGRRRDRQPTRPATHTVRSASRAESGRPVTSPASAGVSSTADAEYHQTVASTRRSVVRCAGARAREHLRRPRRVGQRGRGDDGRRRRRRAARAPPHRARGRPPRPAVRRGHAAPVSTRGAGHGGRRGRAPDPYGVVRATSRRRSTRATPDSGR